MNMTSIHMSCLTGACAALAFTLAGCGGGDSGPSEALASEAASELPLARSAETGRFTVLKVGDDKATIYRDNYGVPHIFAETNDGLFEAYGYAVAEDRLWQLESNRRSSRGTRAEILGPAFVAADRDARTHGYTDAEIDAQKAMLSAEEQAIVEAYARGINRYVDEVVKPDPLNRLPFEFHVLGLGAPEPWTARDAVRYMVFFSLPPPGVGRELTNQAILNNLFSLHKDKGEAEVLKIFDDLRWVNDPDAPATIPNDGAHGKKQRPIPRPHASQLNAVAPKHDDDSEAAAASVAIPRFGSHAWVVSAAKSANGHPMLFGGPQLMFPTPQLMHEVQLKGGNGFNVTGMALAGAPMVAIGRTRHTAWSITNGLAADPVDHYREQMCGAGSGYVFNGGCEPYVVRTEQIAVKGATTVSHTVRRSVHGPVVAETGNFRFARKGAYQNLEIGDWRGLMAMNRAHNIDDFKAAIEQIVSSYNFLYADTKGNIAYWLAGRVPVRPEGFDSRLPVPGDGSAEWLDGRQPIPSSINPARGWLANWNNKPSKDYDNPDNRLSGKQDRLLDIEDKLANGKISEPDMRAIATHIARGKEGIPGRDSRYLKPYLLAALEAVPPTHDSGTAARRILAEWDGNAVADAVHSTLLEPGEVIFNAWLQEMIKLTFSDELGSQLLSTPMIQNQNALSMPNMLLHVLDDKLGSGSGVPPSRDYFNGINPNLVVSQAFDKALQANPEVSWSSRARDIVRFRRADFPTIPEAVPKGGPMLASRRASYAQVVVLSKPKPTAVSMTCLGQSGFVGSGGTLDPHFADQLDLCRNFDYKPMPLYMNKNLQE